MKLQAFLLTCVIFVQSAWAFPMGFPKEASADQKAVLSRISSQVYAGNYDALYEAAKIPAPVAIPYLYLWTIPGSTPEQKETSVAAIKTVQGYADYLRQDMAATTAQGYIPESDFEVLELIATPEAAAVVAPYLFDFKTSFPQHDDVAGDSNVAEALLRLERMKLADAPPPKPSGMPNSDYLMQWQRWVIAKGYVPQSWTPRIGAPDEWLKLEAQERKMGLLPTAGPQLSQKATVVPSISSSVVSNLAALSATSPPAMRTETHGYAFGIIILGLFTLVLIGGIFAWSKLS